MSLCIFEHFASITGKALPLRQIVSEGRAFFNRAKQNTLISAESLEAKEKSQLAFLHSLMDTVVESPHTVQSFSDSQKELYLAALLKKGYTNSHFSAVDVELGQELPYDKNVTISKCCLLYCG